MVRYNPPDDTLSENGWPMVSANKCSVVQVVPSAKKVPILKGDVSTILNAFIILYDREVEKISSQVWGWSDDNDVFSSNHMSGTAIDIGAPKYPWGRRTMSPALVQKVNNLLSKFDGVVFWGRNWSYPDEMHFQIGLPPGNPKIRRLAEKLNNGYLNAYPTEENKEENMSKEQLDRMERTLNQVLSQLGQPGGWPQGGGRTLYDLTSAIAEKQGIPNTRDILAKKEEK